MYVCTYMDGEWRRYTRDGVITDDSAQGAFICYRFVSMPTKPVATQTCQLSPRIVAITVLIWVRHLFVWMVEGGAFLSMDGKRGSLVQSGHHGWMFSRIALV